MKQLILGSQSATRKKLVESWNIPFEIIPANIDEKAIRHSDLRRQTELVARRKAEVLIERYPAAVIITGDTVVVSEGRLLEKPQDLEQAKDMIRTLSGKWCELLTGYCYIDRGARIDESGIGLIRYRFRTIEESELDEYVRTFPVLSWSGAFAPGYPYIDGFLTQVEGSHNSSMYGLPTEYIIPLLGKSGFTIHPGRQVNLI